MFLSVPPLACVCVCVLFPLSLTFLCLAAATAKQRARPKGLKVMVCNGAAVRACYSDRTYVLGLLKGEEKLMSVIGGEMGSGGARKLVICFNLVVSSRCVASYVPRPVQQPWWVLRGCCYFLVVCFCGLRTTPITKPSSHFIDRGEGGGGQAKGGRYLFFSHGSSSSRFCSWEDTFSSSVAVVWDKLRFGG